MTVKIGDCIGFLTVKEILPDGLEPDIIVCLCGCGAEERLHESDLEDWRVPDPTCGHEDEWPLECEACDATDADGNAFCEGCDCCSECCNCTESDCDCDVCEERRGT